MYFVTCRILSKRPKLVRFFLTCSFCIPPFSFILFLLLLYSDCFFSRGFETEYLSVYYLCAAVGSFECLTELLCHQQI